MAVVPGPRSDCAWSGGLLMETLSECVSHRVHV